MKVFVTLRDTVNGETATVEQDDFDYGDDHVVYMYEMGNFACDCNRSLFLYQHRGDDRILDEQRPWMRGELPCNTRGNRIIVDSITNEQGVAFYNEF